MKKLSLLIVSLFVLGVLGWIGYQASIGPCDRPLQYSIGEFDTQFGVSKNDFIKKIISAESVWEKAAGRNLFDYDADATFKINLIYDQRQKEVDNKQKTEFGLSAAEVNFKSLDAAYVSLKNSYESEVAIHADAVKSFQLQEASYEAEVNLWNSKGGAPEKEYQKLEAERQAINTEIAKINQEAANLNAILDKVNSALDSRNQAASNYNSIADAYNKQYGGGIEFDQAEFTGKAINVYEFNNSTDLTIALAHELGHALGMNHVQNPKSIMYYLSGQNSLTPTAEDIIELKKVCHI